MVENLQYVPLLKGKQGEFWALGVVDDLEKTNMVPFIEIPPVPWDWEKSENKKSLEKHLEDIGGQIIKSWSDSGPIFVDFYYLEGGQLLGNGVHPYATIMKLLFEDGVSAIPVTGTYRHTSCQDAVYAAAAEYNCGVCFRLEREDLFDITSTNQYLNEYVSKYDLKLEDCDLIIDLGEIPISGIEDLVTFVMDRTSLIESLTGWRTYTIAATSFPYTLADIATNSTGLIRRDEFVLWRLIRMRERQIPRLPSFGDYGIAHPQLVDVRFPSMRANLRYTLESDWIVLKARNAFKYGFDQFNNLCGELVKLPEYYGKNFSWGDKYIWDCSIGEDGPGNASTWRKVGTSHHISVVTTKLSTLFAH